MELGRVERGGGCGTKEVGGRRPPGNILPSGGFMTAGYEPGRAITPRISRLAGERADEESCWLTASLSLALRPNALLTSRERGETSVCGKARSGCQFLRAYRTINSERDVCLALYRDPPLVTAGTLASVASICVYSALRGPSRLRLPRAAKDNPLFCCMFGSAVLAADRIADVPGSISHAPPKCRGYVVGDEIRFFSSGGPVIDRLGEENVTLGSRKDTSGRYAMYTV